MTSICGKCGGKIPKGQETCPACAPVRKSAESVPLALVLALVCSSFLLVGSSLVNVQTAPTIAVPHSDPPGDLAQAAYEAARKFISEKNSGVQRFSDFVQSGVEHTGYRFVVTLSTDEMGPNSTPLRNFYRVEMEFANNSWALKSIEQ